MVELRPVSRVEIRISFPFLRTYDSSSSTAHSLSLSLRGNRDQDKYTEQRKLNEPGKIQKTQCYFSCRKKNLLKGRPTFNYIECSWTAAPRYLEGLNANLLYFSTNSLLSFGTVTLRALLKKLIVTPLVKEFLIFYKTRRFISVSTRAGHRTLPWVRWIKLTLPSDFILILSSSQFRGAWSGPSPSGFATKIVWLYFSHLYTRYKPSKLFVDNKNWSFFCYFPYFIRKD